MREHYVHNAVTFSERPDVEALRCTVLFWETWSWKALALMIVLLVTGTGRWRWRLPRVSPDSWLTSPGGSLWTSASVTWRIPFLKGGRNVSITEHVSYSYQQSRALNKTTWLPVWNMIHLLLWGKNISVRNKSAVENMLCIPVICWLLNFFFPCIRRFGSWLCSRLHVVGCHCTDI